MHHKIDHYKLSTFVYPINYQFREYQFKIVKEGFYHNLFVALPTGLGKTFIAATILLNYSRWFPNSKIIFAAPTRPLVAQQIRACLSITGISVKKTGIFLDKPKKVRHSIWNSKQIFFSTPQIVEKDLASGSLDPKSIVLLILDEAHRSKGNYGYNNIVKYINKFNKSYRIIGLTATPSSDILGVQEIVENLLISKIEMKTEKSDDVAKYLKDRSIEKKYILDSDDITQCIDLISIAILPVLKIANEKKIYDVKDPKKINAFMCLEAIKTNISNHLIPEGLKWSNFYILQLLAFVGGCYKRLKIYGIKSFYKFFNEKYLEFKTKWEKKKITNKLMINFFLHDEIKKLILNVEKILENPKYISHPKIEVLINELKAFFSDPKNSNSRIIIFTEYRTSALDIVQSINKFSHNMKSHIFIGQSKDSSIYDDCLIYSKCDNKKKNQSNFRSSVRSTSEDAYLKGMKQPLQKKILSDFKNGIINILVATSIGEEGLDIGEVDFVICYDTTSSPIKNIQRMGRTGRKRNGKILFLFSGNEEAKFEKSINSYNIIQEYINKSDSINLHNQLRLIPSNYTPIADKKIIITPEENLDLENETNEDKILQITSKFSDDNKIKKINTKIKKKFFMPDNVETKFITVSEMLKNLNEKESIVSSKSSNYPEDFKKEKSGTIIISDEEDSSDNISISVNIKKRLHTSNPEINKPRTKNIVLNLNNHKNMSMLHLNKSELKESNLQSNNLKKEKSFLHHYGIQKSVNVCNQKKLEYHRSIENNMNTVNESYLSIDNKKNDIFIDSDSAFDDGLDEELALISSNDYFNLK